MVVSVWLTGVHPLHVGMPHVIIVISKSNGPYIL
jgi:hypothetical protein